MTRIALASRPTVGKLTVPFVVDATRRPIDFRALDAAHVEKCAKHDRCGICGRRIDHDRPRAFIGPDDDPRCFADPWMHPACADLAASQCPFIRGRDWREDGDNPLLARYAGGLVTYIADDGAAHRDFLGAWHFEALGKVRRA